MSGGLGINTCRYLLHPCKSARGATLRLLAFRQVLANEDMSRALQS